jgi:hypothetical protein
MQFKAALVSALITVSASAAVAGPIADAGARAEALQAEGKTVEALQALDEAVEAIWTESPLAFRDIKLVDADSAEGAAEERTDRTFRPDETLRVVVQPVGYGYGASEQGASIGFTGDLAVENATGQVLVEEADFFSLATESPLRSREFEMTIGFVVPYIRPGDYVARFTVRDQNSDKSGSFEVPFTVAPAAAADAPAADAGADAAEPAPAN